MTTNFLYSRLRRGATTSNQANQKGLYDNLKRGAKMFILGASLIGLAGCTTIPVAVIEEKAPYEENVPDKILLTDLAKRRDYYKDKVVFEADVAVGSNANYEIFIANKDGSDQKRLTYNKGMDMDPHWTRDGKVIYDIDTSVADYIIDPETGEREEATEEARWDALKFYRERTNREK